MASYVQQMRTAIALILALSAAPALADECRYVSSHDLGTVQFYDDGSARVALIGEPAAICGVNAGDDGGDLLVCDDDELNGMFNFAGYPLGEGDGNELLALWDHVWYRQCQ